MQTHNPVTQTNSNISNLFRREGRGTMGIKEEGGWVGGDSLEMVDGKCENTRWQCKNLNFILCFPSVEKFG